MKNYYLKLKLNDNLETIKNKVNSKLNKIIKKNGKNIKMFYIGTYEVDVVDYLSYWMYICYEDITYKIVIRFNDDPYCEEFTNIGLYLIKQLSIFDNIKIYYSNIGYFRSYEMLPENVDYIIIDDSYITYDDEPIIKLSLFPYFVKKIIIIEDCKINLLKDSIEIESKLVNVDIRKNYNIERKLQPKTLINYIKKNFDNSL